MTSFTYVDSQAREWEISIAPATDDYPWIEMWAVTEGEVPFEHRVDRALISQMPREIGWLLNRINESATI
jgi:hypothetical protein